MNDEKNIWIALTTFTAFCFCFGIVHAEEWIPGDDDAAAVSNKAVITVKAGEISVKCQVKVK